MRMLSLSAVAWLGFAAFASAGDAPAADESASWQAARGERRDYAQARHVDVGLCGP